MDHVKHGRTWTEVKRDVVANFRVGMAMHRQLFQPASLDLVETNDHAVFASPHETSVRPKPAVSDNRWEIIDVCDMEDQNLM